MLILFQLFTSNLILKELGMGFNVLATDILVHITVLISYTSNS